MNHRAAAEKAVMVAATNVEDARLIAELLREDFERVATTSDPDHALGDFESFQPQILVLGFRTLEESERFYLGLYRRSSLIHAIAHRTVVLCQRTDAFKAYELCRKQQFDDYVVFWPVNYDPYRVRMAVLLAARAGGGVRGGPSLVQFAAQARRIGELEQLLQQGLEQGDAHLTAVDDSLRQMEASVDEVIEGFSRRMVDAENAHLLQIRDHGAFVRELQVLRERAAQPFASVDGAMEPVRHWVGALRQDIEPHLESARALGELAAKVRPLVLMVDDDEFQHRLLQNMLAEVPVDLAFAISNTEATASIRGERPDLILMDFQLPDVSGVEATRRLKASAFTEDIPVILITGTSTREVAIESRRAGAVDFMVKPFDRQRLLSGISRHLSGAVEDYTDSHSVETDSFFPDL